MITLSQVRTGIGEHRMCLETHPGLEFTSVVIDSRLATPEALFVALRGEQSDGHTYIRDAWERGARGVIAERETPLDWLPEDKRTGFAYLTVPDSLVALQSLAHHWRRQHRARVIAITGSVGKTTTRQMVAAVLSRQYRVLSSEGNLNTETGVPLTLMRLDDSHERAVIEMGMYGLGEISALCRIAEPEIGVVTNVGPSHLERLGSIERIAKAKGELPAALPAEGWVVLNGDDIRVRPMASKARRIFFGTNKTCQVRAEKLESQGEKGLAFQLALNESRYPVTTPVTGRHLIHACLAAAAVGMIEDISPEDIVAGLENPPPTLRFQMLPGPNGSHLIDDTYNASPVSTLAALDFLAELPGRRVAVLGDMLELGKLEEEGHRQVGRRAGAVLDRLVVIGDRARAIGEEAQASGLSNVHFAKNKEDVELNFRPVDLVLVKGSRGMRMEELVARWRRAGTEENCI